MKTKTTTRKEKPTREEIHYAYICRVAELANVGTGFLEELVSYYYKTTGEWLIESPTTVAHLRSLRGVSETLLQIAAEQDAAEIRMWV